MARGFSHLIKQPQSITLGRSPADTEDKPCDKPDDESE